MELKPNCGSDRAWVYSVPADYADEEIRPELLAIKFANPESMSAFNIQINFWLLACLLSEDAFGTPSLLL
jgi:Ran GTPase-activating protein (Ran-binding protein)